MGTTKRDAESEQHQLVELFHPLWIKPMGSAQDTHELLSRLVQQGLLGSGSAFASLPKPRVGRTEYMRCGGLDGKAGTTTMFKNQTRLKPPQISCRAAGQQSERPRARWPLFCRLRTRQPFVTPVNIPSRACCSASGVSRPAPVGHPAQQAYRGLLEAAPSSRDTRSAISKEMLMLILCTGLGSPPFPPAGGLGWTST